MCGGRTVCIAVGRLEWRIDAVEVILEMPVERFLLTKFLVIEREKTYCNSRRGLKFQCVLQEFQCVILCVSVAKSHVVPSESLSIWDCTTTTFHM